MKIAICTKGRADRQLTLKTICRSFKKDFIYLFVEPQDMVNYDRFVKISNIVSIKENDNGLKFSRKFAINYFNKDEVVFLLDDDIIGFKKRIDKKLVNMNAIEINNMFMYIEDFLLKHSDYGMATISFSASNWLFTGLKKDNTRAWCFKAIINKRIIDSGAKYDYDLDKKGLFEDYDQNLELLTHGLKNVSFYSWAFDTKGIDSKSGGGIRRSQEVVRKSVDYMKLKWGDLVSEFFSEKHGYPEIKVHWKKAYLLGLKNKNETTYHN